jgi:hypothetical protein
MRVRRFALPAALAVVAVAASVQVVIANESVPKEALRYDGMDFHWWRTHL